MTLTLPTARKYARAYAKAQPNRLARAMYTLRDDEGVVQPECIVGQIAVNDLGLDAADLGVDYSAAKVMLASQGVAATNAAGDFLNIVQRFQDGRQTIEEVDAAGLVNTPERSQYSPRTWGEAFECAVKCWDAGVRTPE